MKDDRSKELQKHHNDGEKDASERAGYNEPHGDFGKFLSGLISSEKASDELNEDNKAYEKGYDNGRKQ